MVEQRMQQTPRQRIIVSAVVLLIIAAAVIIYFATRGSSSNSVSTSTPTPTATPQPPATVGRLQPLAHWTSQTSGTDYDLYGVYCRSISQCVSVGQQGTILTSNDGGGTWSSQINPASGANMAPNGVDLSGISCSGSNLCVAVGYLVGVGAGVILTSTNGGATWTSQSNPSYSASNQLLGVSCPSASLCIAVGTAGTILTSMDGGTTWTSQASGTNNDLTAISCPNVNLCVALGSEFTPAAELSTILTSTDGGITWVSQTNPLSGQDVALNGIDCPNTALCSAAGNGIILIGRKGGTRWTSHTSVTNENLSGFSCPTASPCIGVGQSGTILISTDGGTTWTSQTSGTNTFLLGVNCPSTSLCVAVGSAGTVLQLRAS